jgi:zinc transport system substrate-binding protein
VNKIPRLTAANRLIVLFLAMTLALLMSCQAKDEKVSRNQKLNVVTALFPLYDFARNIGQDKADVFLLLPPGLEPHSFEPKPADMIRLNQADLFIYTNPAMEPWAKNVLKGIQSRNLRVIEAGQGIALMADRHGQGPAGGTGAGHENGHRSDHDPAGHDPVGRDPHIWLDFSNAVRMVDHILAGFIEKDPSNRDYYQRNAEAYKRKLTDLDRQFGEGLSGCRKRVLVHGGHFAFGYLAGRYGLKYIALSGFSPDAEPTPANLVRISKIMKANDLHYLFYEELLSPRTAEMIAKETGASLLLLHGAHNISKEDFDRGVGFITLMQKNLENLKRGLQCP